MATRYNLFPCFYFFPDLCSDLCKILSEFSLHLNWLFNIRVCTKDFLHMLEQNADDKVSCIAQNILAITL
jgi:uncharacterized membrane protein YagU involved in acid resistance